MATGTPKSTTDENPKKGEDVKQEILSDEMEQDHKPDTDTEEWRTIDSAKCLIPDLEDNSEVKEEFFDIPEEKFGAVLQEELIELPKEEFENERNDEELQQDANTLWIQKINDQLNVNDLAVDIYESKEDHQNYTKPKTKKSTKRNDVRGKKHISVNGSILIEKVPPVQECIGRRTSLKLTCNNLPLCQKLKLLEELDKGRIKSQLAIKYGVSASTVYNIQKEKKKILSYANNLIEKGETDKMKCTVPKSIRVHLPISKRLNILKDIEQGEPVGKLVEKYGVSQKTLYNIRKEKDKILNYVQNSIEKGDGVELKRMAMPRSKSVVNLPLLKRVKILEELEKGEPVFQLTEKYGVGRGTIYSIKRNKDMILNYVRYSIENGEEDNLKRMALPKTKYKSLTLSKRVNILEEIEKGERAIEVAEKYGVSESTVYNIQKAKDKILSYMQNTMEKGEEVKLKRTALPRSQKVTLPLSKKVKILEELEKGKAVYQLTEKYGVGRGTINSIRKSKNQILSYVHNSIKNGEEDNLKQKALPKSKYIYLPLLKKVNILYEIEEGESIIELAKKYGVSESSIYKIQKEKDKILSYVQNSIEKGDKVKLKRTALPWSKPVTIPLLKRVKILKELDKGEGMSQLAKKYKVAESTICKIQKGKYKVQCFMQNPIENKKEDIFGQISMPKSTPVYLPLSEKVKILDKLEKGEMQVQLAKKYGVSATTISAIQKRKDELRSYEQKSAKKGEQILKQAISPLQKRKYTILNYLQNSQKRREEESKRCHETIYSLKLSRGAAEDENSEKEMSEMPKSLKFAKYSKLEIEDWHKSVVKEEHIDFSDNEAIDDN